MGESVETGERRGLSPLDRLLAATAAWSTVRPGRRHLGWPQSLVLFGVVAVIAVVMVLGGSQRLGTGAGALTAGSVPAQALLGLSLAVGTSLPGATVARSLPGRRRRDVQRRRRVALT